MTNSDKSTPPLSKITAARESGCWVKKNTQKVIEYLGVNRSSNFNKSSQHNVVTSGNSVY